MLVLGFLFNVFWASFPLHSRFICQNYFCAIWNHYVKLTWKKSEPVPHPAFRHLDKGSLCGCAQNLWGESCFCQGCRGCAYSDWNPLQLGLPKLLRELSLFLPWKNWNINIRGWHQEWQFPVRGSGLLPGPHPAGGERCHPQHRLRSEASRDGVQPR